MKTKEEIKNWLLENAVNEYGDLVLSGLDFGDFDGDVHISSMKVKGDLIQCHQEVKGNLHNHNNKYYGELYEKKSKKILKEVTTEELAKLGYTLKGE